MCLHGLWLWQCSSSRLFNCLAQGGGVNPGEACCQNNGQVQPDRYWLLFDCFQRWHASRCLGTLPSRRLLSFAAVWGGRASGTECTLYIHSILHRTWNIYSIYTIYSTRNHLQHHRGESIYTLYYLYIIFLLFLYFILLILYIFYILYVLYILYILYILYTCIPYIPYILVIYIIHTLFTDYILAMYILYTL